VGEWRKRNRTLRLIFSLFYYDGSFHDLLHEHQTLTRNCTIPKHRSFHYAGRNFLLLCQWLCTVLFRILRGFRVRTGLPRNVTVGCIRRRPGKGENFAWTGSTYIVAPRWDDGFQGALQRQGVAVVAVLEYCRASLWDSLGAFAFSLSAEPQAHQPQDRLG